MRNSRLVDKLCPGSKEPTYRYITSYLWMIEYMLMYKIVQKNPLTTLPVGGFFMKLYNRLVRMNYIRIHYSSRII
jgi:hypothetical protein